MNKNSTLLAAILLIIFSCENKKQKNATTPPPIKSTYTLELGIAENAGVAATLLSFYGEKLAVIDSAVSNEAGVVKFTLNNNAPRGMYRLIYSNNNQSDFIFNNEDVKINFAGTEPVIIQSEENKQFFEFSTGLKSIDEKLNMLNSLLGYYPREDDFYEKIEKKVASLKEEKKEITDGLSEAGTPTLAAKLMAWSQYPSAEPGLPDEEQTAYLKVHFFDGLDLSDTTILYSDVLNTRIIKFLKLYQEAGATKEKQESLFAEASDALLARASDNKKVYQFTLDYLVQGFKQFDMVTVLNHLTENYILAESCSDGAVDSTLMVRLEQAKTLAVGKKVPDIRMKSAEGKQVSLSTINTEKILIVFWASWCPHCTKMLPEIKKLYDNQPEKKVEVLTVSIDNDPKAWRDFLKGGDYNWINVCDFKGWKSPAATDYFLYATPTMFLTDSDRNIVAKPTSVSSIKQYFQE